MTLPSLLETSMAEKRTILPLSLPPRGLNREESAVYIGVSPSKFDEMVADGRMPQPKLIDKRLVWDRHELDAAFSALPHRNDPGHPRDVFDECRV
jgi:predicted DNA-binding transcriptional regulator AlpA